MKAIKVNGINYTMTREGYYYKAENGKQKRIPKAEWEAADAEYEKALAEINAEQNKANEFTNVDNETVNAKTKEKKPAKKRKPKDIAYEGNGVTLTAKQVKFLTRLPEDDFYENGLESAIWIDYYCDTIANEFNGMAVGAMVSTLREKGLIYVTQDKVNGKKRKFFTFTENGKAVAKDLGLN